VTEEEMVDDLMERALNLKMKIQKIENDLAVNTLRALRYERENREMLALLQKTKEEER
jgi:hypothetical protein